MTNYVDYALDQQEYSSRFSHLTKYYIDRLNALDFSCVTDRTAAQALRADILRLNAKRILVELSVPRNDRDISDVKKDLNRALQAVTSAKQLLLPLREEAERKQKDAETFSGMVFSSDESETYEQAVELEQLIANRLSDF